MVNIGYDRAKRGTEEWGVYHPVCTYYVQRATYLCVWGQSHDQADLHWRNFRLDRIRTLSVLNWNAAEVPLSLKHAYVHQQRNVG